MPITIMRPVVEQASTLTYTIQDCAPEFNTVYNPAYLNTKVTMHNTPTPDTPKLTSVELDNMCNAIQLGYDTMNPELAFWSAVHDFGAPFFESTPDTNFKYRIAKFLLSYFGKRYDIWSNVSENSGNYVVNQF